MLQKGFKSVDLDIKVLGGSKPLEGTCLREHVWGVNLPGVNLSGVTIWGKPIWGDEIK